jgi:hypothetical protein
MNAREYEKHEDCFPPLISDHFLHTPHSLLVKEVEARLRIPPTQRCGKRAYHGPCSALLV